MQNNAEAQKQFDALIASSKEHAIIADAYYNKGLAYIKQKNIPAAIEAFKQSLKLSPGDNDTRENLQKALNELKQQQPAAQQPQPKPQPNKQNTPQSQMPDRQMLEQKFNELRNQEKQLQKKLQKKNQPDQPEKDW